MFTTSYVVISYVLATWFYKYWVDSHPGEDFWDDPVKVFGVLLAPVSGPLYIAWSVFYNGSIFLYNKTMLNIIKYFNKEK